MASAAQVGLDMKTYMGELGRAAREAGRALARANSGRKNTALVEIAGAIDGARSVILEANARDLAAATRNRLADALLDRLELTAQRVDAMVEGLRQIAALPDPVGEITNLRFQPSGIQVGRMRVPLGVIGIIYESRPNVTADAAGLCLKSGNAAILRGGSEALRSNMAIAAAIRAGLDSAGLPSTAVQVLETIDRAAVGEMLRMPQWIDIIVPRGGKGLIERVSRESLIPVIKHLDGNCHVYIDAYADRDKAIRVAVNAKTRRYGVCGAMESLLVAAAIAADVLPELARELDTLGVELRGCDQSRALVPSMVSASAEDWRTEYLAPILSIKIVSGLDAAIDHINEYGSHHTDSIITEHLSHSRRFLTEVDSSSVMVNTSTQFADGYEYGLGAEIGISTDKLHVRGPVGLEGLTTQKYVVIGDGHVRS